MDGGVNERAWAREFSAIVKRSTKRKRNVNFPQYEMVMREGAEAISVGSALSVVGHGN